jgi:hypothetical protein
MPINLLRVSQAAEQETQRVGSRFLLGEDDRLHDHHIAVLLAQLAEERPVVLPNDHQTTIPKLLDRIGVARSDSS